LSSVLPLPSPTCVSHVYVYALYLSTPSARKQRGRYLIYSGKLTHPGLLPAHERADAGPDNTLFDARVAGLERLHAGAGLASAEEPMRVLIAANLAGSHKPRWFGYPNSVRGHSACNEITPRRSVSSGCHYPRRGIPRTLFPGDSNVRASSSADDIACQ
jgi:hypothetical protein